MAVHDRDHHRRAPLRPEHYLAHAAPIEALRIRIVLVRLTARQIGRDPRVYGRHSGTFGVALNQRYARHDELLAHRQENLDIVVGGMRDIAGDPDLPALPVFVASPFLVVTVIRIVAKDSSGQPNGSASRPRSPSWAIC